MLGDAKIDLSNKIAYSVCNIFSSGVFVAL
jgi:hypothetical protein